MEKHLLESGLATHPAPVAGPSAQARTEAVPAPLAAPTDLVPELVAQVYAEAPVAVRGRLLEHLLKPLGLLSLVAVANGVFAQITMASGWYKLEVSAEDAQRVDSRDVMALVHHVQQVSVPAVESLSKIIAASPVLTGSAAAALLISLLAKQARSRTPVQGNDFDPIA